MNLDMTFMQKVRWYGNSFLNTVASGFGEQEFVKHEPDITNK